MIVKTGGFNYGVVIKKTSELLILMATFSSADDFKNFRQGCLLEAEDTVYVVRGMLSTVKHKSYWVISVPVEPAPNLHLLLTKLDNEFGIAYCSESAEETHFLSSWSAFDGVVGKNSAWRKRRCQACYDSYLQQNRTPHSAAKRHAVKVLNELLEREPVMVKRALTERYTIGEKGSPAAEWILNHPTLVPGLNKGKDGSPDSYDLGLTGLLNGLLCYAEDGDDMERIEYDRDTITKEPIRFGLVILGQDPPIETIPFKKKMRKYANSISEKDGPMYGRLVRMTDTLPAELADGQILFRRYVAGSKYYFPEPAYEGAPGIPGEVFKEHPDWLIPYYPPAENIGLEKFKQEYPEDQPQWLAPEWTVMEQDGQDAGI